MSRFFVAAVTGKSGAGKSEAVRYLESKGVPAVYGDGIAREVVKPGSLCLGELADRFGEGIIDEKGALRRRELARICFFDKEKKAALDSIIHPYIIGEMKARFARLGDAGHRYCAVEAPVLLESGLDSVCDRIILITADEDSAVRRIMGRDGLTEDEARARIAAQTGTETIIAIADAVISNDGAPEEFREKLDALLLRFREWFGGE